MWILWKISFWKCEFCQKWDFENVNFVKNETLKLWILWKVRLWKCEFCEKWDFETVNFVKNDILKLWISWKMRFWKCESVENETLTLWILWKGRFWKCEFCQKWGFDNVNFWMNWGFIPQCVSNTAVPFQKWGLKSTIFQS